MTYAPEVDKDMLVQWGKEALESEAAALQAASMRISDSFAKAVVAIRECKGKVVVSGIGKSGHIAKKIASTLSSTGTSAFFLHPTEALHGDFGMIQSKDVLIAIAFGGETEDVIEVAKYARRVGVPVVGITGKINSSLGKLSNYVFDSSVEKEACPLNLAPTCSSTVTLALGDALAVCLMRARGFSQHDFAALHPSGSLGKRLSLVKDHMHTAEDVSTLSEEADFHAVLEAVTRNNYGHAAVLSHQTEIIGCITDGDLRRAFRRFGGEAVSLRAKDLMAKNPKVTYENALAVDAFRIMEKHKITALFVVENERKNSPIGIVRMHDLLAAKIV